MELSGDKLVETYKAKGQTGRRVTFGETSEASMQEGEWIMYRDDEESEHYHLGKVQKTGENIVVDAGRVLCR